MRAAACLLLGACSFGGSSSPLDAADLDATVDGPDPVIIDGPPPDMDLGAWGPAMPLDLASDGSDDDPSLTGDLLTMYFGSNRSGGFGGEDIWMASRSAVGEAWQITHVDELSSSSADSNVEISSDGLTITFSSDRDAAGKFDLYFATRASTAERWPTPTPVMGLEVPGMPSDEFGGQIVDAGLGIFYCSNRGTDEKIYFAQRTSLSMPFRNPVAIGGIDSAGNECDAYRVDNTLFFTRASSPSSPRDIYVADRKPGAPLDFTEPVLVGPDISLETDDTDPWVSADQRLLFFASNRPDLARSAIYMSVR